MDDDGANRTISKALLESEGYRVVEAQDGVEAVEILEGGRALSLVVLDLDMPRVGGEEVLKTIRDLEEQYDVKEPSKIIMVTALSETEVVDDSFDSDRNGWVRDRGSRFIQRVADGQVVDLHAAADCFIDLDLRLDEFVDERVGQGLF